MSNLNLGNIKKKFGLLDNEKIRRKKKIIVAATGRKRVDEKLNLKQNVTSDLLSQLIIWLKPNLGHFVLIW